MIAVILIYVWHIPGAQAEPITNEPFQNLSSKLSTRWNFLPTPCFGLTDKIHKSAHVPGTVNVVTRTYCPRRGVQISATLTRENDWAEVAKEKKGFGQVTINLAMKCSWRKGMQMRVYVVHVTHRLDDGSIGETTRRAELTC